MDNKAFEYKNYQVTFTEIENDPDYVYFPYALIKKPIEAYFRNPEDAKLYIDDLIKEGILDVEHKSFTYKKQKVRWRKKGFIYGFKHFLYALKTFDGEVYFSSREEAKEYIDKITP